MATAGQRPRRATPLAGALDPQCRSRRLSEVRGSYRARASPSLAHLGDQVLIDGRCGRRGVQADTCASPGPWRLRLPHRAVSTAPRSCGPCAVQPGSCGPHAHSVVVTVFAVSHRCLTVARSHVGLGLVKAHEGCTRAPHDRCRPCFGSMLAGRRPGGHGGSADVLRLSASAGGCSVAMPPV